MKVNFKIINTPPTLLLYLFIIFFNLKEEQQDYLLKMCTKLSVQMQRQSRQLLIMTEITHMTSLDLRHLKDLIY